MSLYNATIELPGSQVVKGLPKSIGLEPKTKSC